MDSAGAVPVVDSVVAVEEAGRVERFMRLKRFARVKIGKIGERDSQACRNKAKTLTEDRTDREFGGRQARVLRIERE